MHLTVMLGALVLPWFAHAQAVHQAVLKDADSSYDPFATSFDEYVEGSLKTLFTPGMAIAVVRGNDTWTKGYGLADIDSGEKMTSNTLFHGASTTKVHTASLVALLAQDNDTYRDITFETRLHDIIPDFKLEDMYETVEVTFADALSHRTGMPRHDLSWLSSNASVEDQVHSLRYLPRTAPFRTKWQYCNLMFTAVGHAIQTVTKTSLGKLYADWLWQPLNLTTTYSSIEDAQQCQQHAPDCKIAKHYLWSNSSRQFVERDPNALPGANGATGWITNMVDQAKWLHVLIHGGRPVNSAGHAALRSPLSFIPNPKGIAASPLWYGMGLHGQMEHGHAAFGHTGAIGSYYTNMLFVPQLEWGFVIMQNAPTCAMNVIGRRLLDDLMGIPASERSDSIEKCLDDWQQSKEKIEAQPEKLYPRVLDPPRLPAAQVSDYAGTYSHSAFGSIVLVPGLPASGVFKGRAISDRGSMMTLHANLALLEVRLVFHHVSGEEWLVAIYSHENLDDDVPERYTKARSIVGASGQVEAFDAMFVDSEEGQETWVKLLKVV